jgi:hypothetical protein
MLVVGRTTSAKRRSGVIVEDSNSARGRCLEVVTCPLRGRQMGWVDVPARLACIGSCECSMSIEDAVAVFGITSWPVCDEYNHVTLRYKTLYRLLI